jgi:hypothetical protein
VFVYEAFTIDGTIESYGNWTGRRSHIVYSAIVIQRTDGKQILNAVLVGPNVGTQIGVGNLVRAYLGRYSGGLIAFGVAADGHLHEDLKYIYRPVRIQFAFFSLTPIFDGANPLKGVSSRRISSLLIPSGCSR